ncbi:PHP domain-containing protein [Microbacterium sp. Marseille-Q6965]|uniref:PHP domain-containing protein n=1 Tax=Microbacterium sp. Marseille-Q6965 TaxID=2965072 RepID=UPI0021B7B7E2|nr:PHP domain-containing protein [Microbacterium sp. Marseille-Q6965]
MKAPLPRWADPSVPASLLGRRELSRRALLGALGAGAGIAALGAAPASAAMPARAAADAPSYIWLVGDHHAHTVYSSDAKYTLSQVTERAQHFGVDWIAFTEHSNVGHADGGGALAQRREILAARADNPRMMVFQGLEWYIPAAEHGTVMVAPGPNEARLLRSFELAYDGNLLGYTQGAEGHADTARNEEHAREALRWLARRKAEGFVDDVLVFANHPARLGIDSPAELRGWRDAADGIMVGMEGAPGAQAAALPGWRANGIRGEYENARRADSWSGYPDEAWVTYGGFDWMTATVGGMWDAMLAEGRGWWITSNSDVHRAAWDRHANGTFPQGVDFAGAGRLPDPVLTEDYQPGSDFWPGEFSRTHVGVTSIDYLSVMDALRAGRVWVDHGQLVGALDVRLRDEAGTASATLGERLTVPRGSRLVLEVTITAQTLPNSTGAVPALAHVDVIRGAVTGAAPDPTSWRAPDTRVVESVDVSGREGTFTLIVPLVADASCYVRLRGSDGKQRGVGLLGAEIDPAGPISRPRGDGGSPWDDLWFYANPIFVDVTG